MSKKFFDYFICLSNINRGSVSREDIFYFLDQYSTRLLVALENHANSSKIHFHIYMKSLTKVCLNFLCKN